MPSQAKQDEAGRASFWTIWTLRNSVARRIKDKTCFEDLGLPLATIVVRVRGPVPSSKGLTFIDREYNYLNFYSGMSKTSGQLASLVSAANEDVPPARVRRH